MRVLFVALLVALGGSPDGKVELDQIQGNARHFWGFAVDEQTCRVMSKALELGEQGSAFACYAPDDRPVANERDLIWLRLTDSGEAADYAIMGTPDICARAARGLQRAYALRPSAVWSCVPRHSNA
jgi:hypothetical protein